MVTQGSSPELHCPVTVPRRRQSNVWLMLRYLLRPCLGALNVQTLSKSWYRPCHASGRPVRKQGHSDPEAPLAIQSFPETSGTMGFGLASRLCLSCSWSALNLLVDLDMGSA
jgi:hypothetical protein